MLHQLLIFAKAQLSAFVGGVTDYAVMVFVTEIFHVHYTISIAIGGVIGAVVNFSINKRWTFRSKYKNYKAGLYKQLLRFSLVAVNSILLKSSGTFIITTFIHIDYKISRIIVDLFVSLLFNYTLQRFWVFSKKPIATKNTIENQ
ncbi:MAG: polysaccharide biosynthesis protein GtrA [Porphyromonadaceae bacterium CG2_30_38_12]|nr:MAG: polysaccharide biosynthesis protein GtrA [Porphyromonadaceae bacterium CG2_30_38_12]